MLMSDVPPRLFGPAVMMSKQIVHLVSVADQQKMTLFWSGSHSDPSKVSRVGGAVFSG